MERFLETAARSVFRLCSCFIIFAVALSSTAFAAPTAGITYTGRILDANDRPINAGNVTFFVWLQTPNFCSLFSEQHIVNMTASAGTYTLEIGKGTLQSFPHNGFGIKTLADVFDNSKKASDFNVVIEPACSNVQLANDEARILRVEFIPPDQTTAQALPPLRITAVPFSMQAENSLKVGGYGAEDLIKIDTSVSKVANPNVGLSQIQYDEFWQLIAGTSLNYLKPSAAFGGDVSGSYNAISVDRIKGKIVDTTGITNNKILKYDGAKWIISDDLTGTSPGNASASVLGIMQAGSGLKDNGSGDGVISVDGGTNAGQVLQFTTNGVLPALDGSLLTNLNATGVSNNAIGSSQIIDGSITNSDIASVAWSKITGTPTTLVNYGITDAITNLGNTPGISSGLDSAKPLSPANGEIFIATDIGKIYRWNGSAWMVVSTRDGAFASTLAAGQVWVGNSSSVPLARALSGDIASITDTGLVTATKTSAGLANTLVATDGAGVVNSFGVGLKGSVSGTVTLSSITGTTANYSLKFPAIAPSVDQILVSNAAGDFSWTDLSSLGSSSALPLAGGTMTGAIVTSAGSAAAPALGVGAATSGLFSGGSNILAFSTAGTERMRLSETGKLGIGQNNPFYELDVVGTAHILGDFAAENAANNGSGPNFNLWKSRNYSATQANDILGSFSIFGHDGSSLRRGAYISAVQQSNSTATSVPTNLTFATAAVGNTDAVERMRISSTGSVGIGTLVPTHALHIKGSFRSNNYILDRRAYNLSLSASNWYRILTLPATNESQFVKATIWQPLGHDQTVVELRKSTYGNGMGWTAEVFKGAAYEYTQNITNVRIVDDGTNASTHIDIQVGANVTSKDFSVSFEAEDGTSSGNYTPYFTDFANMGAAAAGVVFPVTQVLRSYGSSLVGAPVYTLKGDGKLGLGISNPTNQFQIVGSNGLLSFGATGWNDPGPNGATIVSDNAGYKALMIVGNNIPGNSGRGREVKVYDYLNVQGVASASVSMYSPAYYYTSDRRLKKNIRTINSALDKVNSMRGVNFDWKNNDQADIGFIAQEVEEVLPELVNTSKDQNHQEVKTVKYGNIVAVVLQAVKELYSKWSVDHAMLATQAKEIENIKLMNQQLLEQNKLLKEAICETNSQAKICLK